MNINLIPKSGSYMAKCPWNIVFVPIDLDIFQVDIDETLLEDPDWDIFADQLDIIRVAGGVQDDIDRGQAFVFEPHVHPGFEPVLEEFG